MQRYFVSNRQINKGIVEIVDQDFHHIKNVMRMKIAVIVEICDEIQNVYTAKLLEFKKNSVLFSLIDKLEVDVELKTDITIALGLTRTSKIEEVIRRITELGASNFIPVEMNRSVVRLNKNVNYKQNRLEMIVKEASEQSKRTKLMKIHEPIKFNQLLDNIDDYDYLVYAYEDLAKNSKNKFKSIIPSFKNKKVLVIVGPEGGFTTEEVDKLDRLGFISVGLGPRILRLETAPLYIMSAISYELEL
ncbi:MAG TPA: 16S rRNA (uracil(1498)-N(3))-methyltransferase [Acholeplasmataceae bacterium]|nr:16S rRNA (uracil(1498)-N(3))-methyltransferase [Acholeplasmataceae bacterium]